jgi:hypothetical protein
MLFLNSSASLRGGPFANECVSMLPQSENTGIGQIASGFQNDADARKFVEVFDLKSHELWHGMGDYWSSRGGDGFEE